jgi:hypothetical protein
MAVATVDPDSNAADPEPGADEVRPAHPLDPLDAVASGAYPQPSDSLAPPSGQPYFEI